MFNMKIIPFFLLFLCLGGSTPLAFAVGSSSFIQVTKIRQKVKKKAGANFA